MYVIRLENTTNAAVHQVSANSHRVVAADLCQWEERNDSSGGYQIANVRVYNGGTAAGDNYGVTGITSTLGYIGKSGRFVAITNPLTHS